MSEVPGGGDVGRLNRTRHLDSGRCREHHHYGFWVTTSFLFFAEAHSHPCRRFLWNKSKSTHEWKRRNGEAVVKLGSATTETLQSMHTGNNRNLPRVEWRQSHPTLRQAINAPFGGYPLLVLLLSTLIHKTGAKKSKKCSALESQDSQARCRRATLAVVY